MGVLLLLAPPTFANTDGSGDTIGGSATADGSDIRVEDSAAGQQYSTPASQVVIRVRTLDEQLDLIAATSCRTLEMEEFYNSHRPDEPLESIRCGQNYIPPPVIAEISAQAAQYAFDIVTVTPPQFTVEPPGGWAFVNTEAIVYTNPASQTLSTTLLGHTVQVRVQPVQYIWNFGDGTVLRTTDPGQPYPHHTVFHTYQTAGDRTISLQTVWSGQYRIIGYTGWRPVAGNAVTTSPGATITLVESESVLVNG